MATPNADRLRAIDDWNPGLIEHTNQTLGKINGRLQTIAQVNRRVAADLGLEGEAAQSASARLDTMASRLHKTSQDVDTLIKVQDQFVEGGRRAQHESRAIQKDLDSVNGQVDKARNDAKNTPVIGGLVDQVISGYVEQVRNTAHAEIDGKAEKVLKTLDAHTNAVIAGLPKRDLSSFVKKLREKFERDKKGRTPERHQDSPDRGSSRRSPVPSRSATDWRVSAPPASAGTAGGYDDAGSHSVSPSASSVSLQNSHYTTSQSSELIPRPGSAALHSSSSSSHSSAIFNPLATSAALGGGAAVTGYKAYQAARAALAAKSAPTSKAASMRSGAAVRSAPSSGSGILKGATTAVRAPSSATSVGKAGSVSGANGASGGRAGASGAARGGLAARSTSSTAARANGSARGATASGAAGRTGGSSSGRSAGSFGGRSAGMGVAGRGGSGSAGRSASSRAIAGLTGGRSRGRDKKEDYRSRPIEETQVSMYEDDKTVTFLEAGRREDLPRDGAPA